MKQTILFLLAFLSFSLQAQTREYIKASIDKDCYLTGEQILVHVSVTDAKQQPMAMSRVAYVELCDTRQMHAGCMVQLDDAGEGWAHIDLPGSMHSGYFQMSVYTRYLRNFGSDAYFKQLVPVVNVLHPSADDDVVFVEKKDGKAIEVEPTDFKISAPAQGLQDSKRFVGELFGHLVLAKATNGEKVASSRLALVGKRGMVFDGQVQEDGSVMYYTQGINGSVPVTINGYTLGDDPIQMEFISPYEVVLPKQLPSLVVNYDEEKLRERSVAAQVEKSKRDIAIDNAVAHDKAFMGVEPEYFYDLDEWTKFKTVREILIEFVEGIRVRSVNKHKMLFTFEPGTNYYSKWSALVLLDGMPVYDIDALMDYDARRLKYVQIYRGRYQLGENLCSGVISFISRKGALQDFRPDSGTQMFTYDFPHNK